MARRHLTGAGGRIAAAAVLLAAGCAAPPPPISPAARQPRRTVFPTTGPVSVPLEVDTRLPVLTVGLADGSTRRFLLDTGAYATNFMTTGPGAVRHGPPAYAQFLPGGAGRPTPVGLEADCTLSVGGVRFEHFDAVTLPYADPFTGDLARPLTGGLGWPLFADVLLTVDYAAERVTLGRGELPPPNGADVLPLRVDPQGLLELPITIAGRSTWAVIDTGAGVVDDLSVDPAWVPGLPWQAPPTRTTAQLIAGPSSAVIGHVAGDLRIGRYAVPSPLVDEAGGTGNVLSAATLRHFRVTFDVGHRRVRLAGPVDAPAGCDRVAAEDGWDEADERVRRPRRPRWITLDAAAARRGVIVTAEGTTWVVTRPGPAKLLFTTSGVLVDLVGPCGYTLRTDGGVDMADDEPDAAYDAARWYERAGPPGQPPELVCLNPFGVPRDRHVDLATGAIVTRTDMIAVTDRPDGTSRTVLADGLVLDWSADNDVRISWPDPPPAGPGPARR